MSAMDEAVEAAARACANVAPLANGMKPWTDHEWQQIRVRWLANARPAVEAAAPYLQAEALSRVIGYCRLSETMAEEATENPYAVGLARAYKDVADRLEARADALTAEDT